MIALPFTMDVPAFIDAVRAFDEIPDLQIYLQIHGGPRAAGARS